MTTLIPLLVLLALAGSYVPSFAWANPLTQDIPTSLKLNDATKARTKGQLVLSATLKGADNKPLSKRGIDFYQQAEFFGPREAFLGTAQTDSSGTALFAYQPAETGTQQIVARFAGGGGYAKAEASGTIEVAEAINPFRLEDLPLAQVREWLPPIVGVLVLATWSVMAALLVATVERIAAAARDQQAG